MQVHYKIQWHFLRLLARSYFRLSVEGCEHIPSSGPVLIAANHCSFLDPPLIALGIPRQITFLAKEELFSVPLMGRWMRWVGAFPVSRKQGDIKAMRSALRLLGEGKALLVFPEGTRSPDGTLQPLESGLAWLACKSQAPVVPLIIGGSHEALPRSACFPRPYKVHVEVGPALEWPKMGESSIGRKEISVYNQQLSGIFNDLSQKTAAVLGKRKLLCPEDFTPKEP